MVRPTRCTHRQVHNNNDCTSVLFAAAFAHIEPVEEVNDEVGGGGVAHVGVAGGSGGFGGRCIGDGCGGGFGGEVVGHGSVSHGVVTGGVVGIGVVGIGVVGVGVVGGGAIGGGAIGGGAIGGVGSGSSTNDYSEDIGNNDDNKAGANNEAGANNKATNNDQDNLATGDGGDLMEDETNSMIVEDGGINNNDNNNEANDYGNNNDEANNSANNNNDDANNILGGGGGMDGLEAELEHMMEGEAGNPSNHSSSITISSVRDGVVVPHTLKMYCKEILKFLNWCRENKPNWLQAVALLWLDEIQTRAPNEHVCAFKARVQQSLKVLL